MNAATPANRPITISAPVTISIQPATSGSVAAAFSPPRPKTFWAPWEKNSMPKTMRKMA